MRDLIDRQAAIAAIVDKGVIGDSKVKCLSCGHHIAERPFEVYCNIMCKWVNEKDYCTMFEPAHTMEEFEKEVVDAECITDGQQMFPTEEWKMRKTEA